MNLDAIYAPPIDWRRDGSLMMLRPSEENGRLAPFGDPLIPSSTTFNHS